MSMQIINENDRLQNEVSNLPREVQPKRDLWPGIELAISQKTKVTNSNYQWLTKVAAAALPVALVTGLWLSSASKQQDDLAWLKPVSASFEIQKRQLLQQVSSNTVVSTDWQQSLKELELAEKALIRALANQPNDPALMKMLESVYRQQLDVIKHSHAPQYTQI